jgi:hypothetical protein
MGTKVSTAGRMRFGKIEKNSTSDFESVRFNRILPADQQGAIFDGGQRLARLLIAYPRRSSSEPRVGSGAAVGRGAGTWTFRWPELDGTRPFSGLI